MAILKGHWNGGEMKDYSTQFHRDKLKPITDTWPTVRDILGVRGFDAISFVENSFLEMGLALYLPDADTGLYKQDSENGKYHLDRLGVCDEAHRFANEGKADFGGWTNLRITPADFERIISRATGIARNEPDAASIHGNNGYPDELRAAIEAFEAVRADHTLLCGRSPKTVLAEWLEKHKPELSASARDRIATVANWQREGGAPRTPD